jgi:hypothetical protein
MANTTFRWVATLSDLYAESGMVNGEVGVVEGYASAGDGGGGTFSFATTIPNPAKVSNVSAAGLVEITTTADHTLLTGQRVRIGGVTGTGLSSVNATWTITVTATNKFTLDGSSITGSYTSGGAVGNFGMTLPSNSATAGIWTRQRNSDANVLDVRCFGAVRDSAGGGDAIQFAIKELTAHPNDYAYLLIPAGTWWLTAALNLGHLRMEIRGAGWQTTGDGELFSDGGNGYLTKTTGTVLHPVGCSAFTRSYGSGATEDHYLTVADLAIVGDGSDVPAFDFGTPGSTATVWNRYLRVGVFKMGTGFDASLHYNCMWRDCVANGCKVGFRLGWPSAGDTSGNINRVENINLDACDAGFLLLEGTGLQVDLVLAEQNCRDLLLLRPKGNNTLTNIVVRGVHFETAAYLASTTASAGQTLPVSSLTVAATSAFPSSGTLSVTTGAGVQTVTYTNKTSTTFTGCSGGVGTTAASAPVFLGNSLITLDGSLGSDVGPAYVGCSDVTVEDVAYQGSTYNQVLATTALGSHTYCIRLDLGHVRAQTAPTVVVDASFHVPNFRNCQLTDIDTSALADVALLNVQTNTTGQPGLTEFRKSGLSVGFGRYTVPSSVAVADAVYATGADTADRADASTATKMPAFGFVVAKLDTTTALVARDGTYAGFSGLTAGSAYYVSKSTPGRVTTDVSGYGVGNVVQAVGFAKNTTSLALQIDRDIVVL